MVIKGYELEPLSQNKCFDERSFSAGLFGTKLDHDDGYREEYWLFTDKKHKNLVEVLEGEGVIAKGKTTLFRCFNGSFTVKGLRKFESEEGCPCVLRFAFSVQVCETKSFYNTAMGLLSKNPIWKKSRSISMRNVWDGLELKECCQKHLGDIALECLDFCDVGSFERRFKKRGEKWLNDEMQSEGLLSKGLQATVLEGNVEIDEFEKKKKELEKKLEEIKKRG